MLDLGYSFDFIYFVMPKKKEKLMSAQENTIMQGSLESFARVSILVLLFGMFFVPFFSFDVLFQPQRFSKVLLYFSIITAMSCLFGLFFARNRFHWLPQASLKPFGKHQKHDWIAISIVGFLLSAGISTALGVDVFQGFWGTMGWANGMITIIFFTTFFFVVTAMFRERLLWKWLLRVHLVSCLLMTLWSFLQHLNGTLPFAAFGNTGYFAGYMLFAVFEGAVLFLWEKEMDAKIFSAAVSVIIACVLFFVTDIRSAQVGIAVGLLAILWLYCLASRRKLLRVAAVGVFGLGIVTSIGVGWYLTSSGKISSLFERSTTVQTRLTTWGMAIDGFWQRPIIGYGPENFPFVFEKYFNPGFYEIQSPYEVPVEYTFYQPHNKILEVAVAQGIIGVLTYLSIFAAICWALFLRYVSSRDLRYLVLAGMFIGYLAHLVFHFDTITTFFAFYFSLAFAYVLLRTEDQELEYCVNLEPRAFTPFARDCVSVGVLFVGALILWKTVVVPVWYNVFLSDTIRSIVRSVNSQNLSRIVQESHDSRFLIQDEAILSMLRDGTEPFKRKESYNNEERTHLAKLVDLGEYAFSQRPQYSLIAAFTGQAANVAGAFDPSFYQRAIVIGEKAIQRGAKRQEVFFTLAESYAFQGNREKAIEYAKKGIDLDPGYGLAYSFASRVYFIVGDEKSGLASLEDGFAQGLQDPISYNFYIEHARKIGEYDKAIRVAQKAVDFSPGNVQILANLAMLYYEHSDFEQSKKVLETLKTRFPTHAAEADKLIQQANTALTK